MIGKAVKNGQDILDKSVVIGESMRLQSQLYYYDGRFYVMPAMGRSVMLVSHSFAVEHFPDSFGPDEKPLLPPPRSERRLP